MSLLSRPSLPSLLLLRTSSHETRVFVCPIEWRSPCLPPSPSPSLVPPSLPPRSVAKLVTLFSLSPILALPRRTTRTTDGGTGRAQPTLSSHFMNLGADARKLHLTMCEERGRDDGGRESGRGKGERSRKEGTQIRLPCQSVGSLEVMTGR